MVATSNDRTIKTDDGKKFCHWYVDDNGEIVYESKEGKVHYSRLMQQTYGRDPVPGRKGRRIP